MQREDEHLLSVQCLHLWIPTRYKHHCAMNNLWVSVVRLRCRETSNHKDHKKTQKLLLKTRVTSHHFSFHAVCCHQLPLQLEDKEVFCSSLQRDACCRSLFIFWWITQRCRVVMLNIPDYRCVSEHSLTYAKRHVELLLIFTQLTLYLVPSSDIVESKTFFPLSILTC